MKKIGLFCLCLASLSLTGCFHIPDEDWLLNSNKVDTGNIDEEHEIQQAFNSLMDGINMVSSGQNEIDKNEIDKSESDKLYEELNNIETSDETLNIEKNDIVIEESWEQGIENTDE